MGKPALHSVRSQALELNEVERAELAHDLVISLDGLADSDAAHEWETEIVRRLDDIDSGTAKLIDREEFTRRMRERLSQL
ncbi:MAG: addiction module protein [Pyrinomonadaceae bacterium]